MTDVQSITSGRCTDTVEYVWEPGHSFTSTQIPQQFTDFKFGLGAWTISGTCSQHEVNGYTCGTGSYLQGTIDAGSSGGYLMLDGDSSVEVDGHAHPPATPLNPDSPWFLLSPGTHTVKLVPRSEGVRTVGFANVPARDLGTLDTNKLHHLVRGTSNGGQSSRVEGATLYDFTLAEATNLRTGCDVHDQTGKGWTKGVMQSGLALEPGKYRAICYDNEVLAGYDVSLETACHQLLWFFGVKNRGVPVTDLKKGDIKVLVDGVDPGTEGGLSLTTNNRPLVSLLLDASYSVSEAGAEQQVRTAAQEFTKALPEGSLFNAAQFASEASVPKALPVDVDLSSGKKLAANVFSVPALALGVLGAYDAYPVATSDAATKLFDAASVAASAMFSAKSSFSSIGRGNMNPLLEKQRVAVIFSDGNDTASKWTTSAIDTRKYFERCRVRPFAVALGDVEGQDLAMIAGKDVVNPKNAAELPGAFEKLKVELNSLYKLRVVTAEPKTITRSSVITVTYKGVTKSQTFTPPSESCVPPSSWTGFPTPM